MFRAKALHVEYWTKTNAAFARNVKILPFLYPYILVKILLKKRGKKGEKVVASPPTEACLHYWHYNLHWHKIVQGYV